MPPPGGVMTPIASAAVAPQQPGFAFRAGAAVRGALSGAFNGWFGPNIPLPPIAPPEVKGRAWDYPTGANLSYIPRSQSPIGFYELRALADSLPLLRAVIETRKDQIESLDYMIRPRDTGSKKKKIKAADDPASKRVSEFLLMPDRRHSLPTWMRMLVEEMLVTDATCIYPRLTRGGGLYSADVIDGATVFPLLGEDGRSPMPPDPAYQQIIKGVVAAEFTSDELIYLPRNVRIHSRGYGYSPVEQIVLTINIALRRDVSTLEYYRQGSVPDAFGTLPKEWSVDQIRGFQDYFDGLLAGDLAGRRRMKFMPGDFRMQETHAPPLKDQYDEWLARIICYVFSVPISPFVNQVNRACYSADTETLTDNGWKLLPDIADGERIATYNPATGRIEYHAPLERRVYPMDGEMVRFAGRSYDTLVTPEHDMWLAPPQSDTYRKVKAKDAPRGQFKFLGTALFDGVEQKTFLLPGVSRNNGAEGISDFLMVMDDWLEFLGLFLSEGGLSHKPKHYMLTLAQKAGPKADKISALLVRLGFSYSEYPNLDKGCRRWNVYGKNVHQWLIGQTGGRCEDKRIPRQFLSLSQRQLGILFTAMMDGDGTWDKREGNTNGAYHTCSPQLADDFQELAFKLGYSTTRSIHYEAHGNRQQAYRVTVCRRDYHLVRFSDTGVGRNNVTREDYAGSVYCFEVPNHLFVTRRNGKVGIHGNTGETLKLQATQEGMIPLKRWLKNMLDRIINQYMGETSVEFAFNDEDENDPLEQAQTLVALVGAGIINRDQANDQLGNEPIPGGAGAEYTITTGSGVMPITVPEEPTPDPNAGAATPHAGVKIGADGKPLVVAPNTATARPQPPKGAAVATAQALQAKKSWRQIAYEKDFGPDQPRASDGKWTVGSIPSIVIAANRVDQKAKLTASWEQYGRPMDFEDIPEAVYERERAAWQGSEKDFDAHLDAKYLEGRIAPFPGVREANDYFEGQGEQEHGVYLAGRQPEGWLKTGEPDPKAW